MAYRNFSRTLWVNDSEALADFLPALSVWVKDDDRPFARLWTRERTEAAQDEPADREFMT